MSANEISVGPHRDKSNDEMASQRTGLERSHVIFVAKSDFVELLKQWIAAKKASFVRQRKKLEAMLV